MGDFRAFRDWREDVTRDSGWMNLHQRRRGVDTMGKDRHEQITASKHLQIHEQYLISLIHADDLLKYQSNHVGPILGQLDFHVMFPILFPAAGNGSKPMIPHVKNWFRQVLNRQDDMGLKFFVTAPTFLEFLDQIQHHRETITDVITKQIDYIKNTMNPIDPKMFATSATLRRWLTVLTEYGFEQSIRSPINDFSEMFDRGLLHGIGDLPSLPTAEMYRQYSKVVKKIYERHVEARLAADTGRSEADSKFHYKIDAANMGISKILQARMSQDLFIFTRTHYIVRSMGSLARCDLALPVLLNILDHGHNISQRLASLQCVIEDGIRNRDRIRELTPDEMAPKFLMTRLARFYTDAWGLINGPADNPAQLESFPEATYEELVDVLQSPDRLQDGIERAVEGLRDGATTLVKKFARAVNLDVIEGFELDNDPVYQKLRSSLGI